MIKRMNFKLYHVFTGQNALGNPAAVMLLDSLPSFEQHLEFNSPCKTRVYLSHQHANRYDISWMNDANQISRCGHGTLAAAEFLKEQGITGILELVSAKDCLTVSDGGDGMVLTLPEVELTDPINLSLAFDFLRLACTANPSGYIIIELENEDSIKNFSMNEQLIASIGERALIISAKAENSEVDIVFRYFAPQYGSFEDSATGSAACVLWPFWKDNLNKKSNKDWITCYQASKPGGRYQMKGLDNQISIKGQVHAQDY